MKTTELAHAYISVPADCLPLVDGLIFRLVVTVTEGGGNALPVLPMPKIERGGAMIKALRQRAGMTQKALADAVNIPQSHISDFEKNRRAVPYKHAQRLADVLHSIPSHFMTPNADTLAAMNGAGEDVRQTYDTPEAMYKDLGI